MIIADKIDIHDIKYAHRKNVGSLQTNNNRIMIQKEKLTLLFPTHLL